MAPSQPKKPKLLLASKQDEDDLVFTACHILGGKCDGSLAAAAGQDLGVRRGRAIIGLWPQLEQQPQQQRWSLAVARSTLQRYHDPKQTLQSSPLSRFQVFVSSTGGKSMAQMLQCPLVSLAHVLLANDLMNRALQDHKTEMYEMAHSHLTKSLSHWPCNPSALLCFANLVRMGVMQVPKEEGHRDKKNGRLEMALEYYLAAAKCAHLAQEFYQVLLALDQLSNDDKYLLETLLTESAQMEEEEETDNDDQVIHGPSKALVTASYMSAMLASTCGLHDLAKEVLKRFARGKEAPQRITRIHPNVWKAAAASPTTTPNKDASEPLVPTKGAFCPCIFPNTIPDDLFQTLRYAFRPGAPYWNQSQYDRNVYYSFWTDWPLPQPPPKSQQRQSYIVSNAVEHYIVSHLLPRIRSMGANLDDLRGFEWWVHTRPHGANLGHQLHFDTDEALLDQDGTVNYPISASVTYLSLDDAPNTKHNYGATIILDQTSTCTESASAAWICPPRPKSFLIFPGDLLHGVLPCIPNDENGSSSINNNDTIATPPHRLTFMVNFWSYRIPSGIHKPRLYGPSGPFPPPTRHHSWTRDICQNYPQTVPLPQESILPTQKEDEGLKAVTPAWETLLHPEDANHCATTVDPKTALPPEWAFSCPEDAPLKLPSSGGINQRFFVANAPHYFHSTLFEK